MAEGSNGNVLRAFEPANDFEAYSKLWDDGICPPISSLPQNGVVIGEHLMGFLAMTDCDFTIMTWYQFGLDSKGIDKHRAFNEYIKWCLKVAKDNGKKYVFCFSNKNSIMRILESHKHHEIERGHFVLEVF